MFCPVEQSCSYDDIKDTLQTGDIFLFSGAGLSSLWVKLGTFSSWSHVGMVVRCDHIAEQEAREEEESRSRGLFIEGEEDEYSDKVPHSLRYKKDNLFLWHCNSSALVIEDIITGIKKRGNQLSPLRIALRTYQGSIYLRRTVLPMAHEAEQRMCHKTLHDFIVDAAPKTYTDNLFELALAAYDGPAGGNVDQFETYFCSKLVAHTLIILQWLDYSQPASEYVPKDFSSTYMSELSHGIVLETELRINMTPISRADLNLPKKKRRSKTPGWT